MTDSAPAQHGPPFLQELAPNVTLDAAILKDTAHGPDLVRKIVGLVGSQFASQSPGFHTTVGDTEIYEYKAVMPNGDKLTGIVTVTRGADGKVIHVGSMIRPLGAVNDIAKKVAEALGEAK